MRFKDTRLAQEYNQLPIENKRLYQLMAVIDQFTELEFKKDVCITCILRTKSENDALYAQVPVEQRPNSPHLNWEGVDIRSTDFTPSEIDRLLKFINTFTFRNGKQVGVYHQVAGNALHFHIQYAKG